MNALTIRARILLAIAVPAITLLAAFSAIVFLRVRSDRLDDVDESLEQEAVALAALVERDHGEWEVDFGQESEVVGDLAAWEVRIHPDGSSLSSASADEGVALRTRSFVLEVVSDDAEGEEDDEDGAAEGDADGARGPALVQITVARDLGPLEADLRGLLGVISAVGVLFAGLALFLGNWLSRRIVDPLERMAARAEAVVAPSPDPPLPLGGSGDEIDRLAATLNRTFGRLYESWARQARFTADASHELRTPLAVIRASAEVALRKERPVAEYREAMGTIVDGVGRMQETLDGLLLLARADAGATEAVVDRIDATEVAREALAAAQHLRGATGLTFVLEAPAPQAVVGDLRQLSILVGNLLSNAVRHTPAGGTVTVTVSRERDRVVLTVRDTGEGIPPEALGRVFERFFRADEARSRDRGGVGLGLAIVKAIAVAHGGDVRVVSRAGEGSSVIVTLPAA